MFTPLTPIRFLHRAVDLYGDQVGVVCGEQQFTYAQFGERCERLAAALTAVGIVPGDRVAYLSLNNHQLLEGYYGVVQARAVVMPLNVRLAPQEIIAILCHSGARMLLFEDDFAPLIERLRPTCPAIENYVSLSGNAAADLSYDELVSRGRPERADVMSFDETAIAELFYTSGSTGTPKGVMLSHRTIYLHGMSVATLYEHAETVVDLHTIPLFHANGWGRPQASTMLGIKQVMVRRFDPNFVLRMIEEHRATHMSLVPTMANALVNCADLGKYDLSSVREVMIGGAASSPDLIARVEKALGGRCYAGYGLTETAPVLTCARVKRGVLEFASEEERLRRQAMAGWPVPGVELRVVDPSMKDVPKDGKSIGEIVTRGDHIMDGYYKDPEGTAAVMSGEWFHSGDMAVWDEQGYFHIVDRKKEIIISGGENISSLEVEKAIIAHPEVFECAVVAAPDDTWGEVPAAIVVRKPGSDLTSEGLKLFLQDRLGRFKMPKIIEVGEEALPKTGTGKVRKLVLKEKYWTGKAKRVQG